MTPDPQTVRDVAREHIRSGRTCIGDTVWAYFNGALREEEFATWEHKVSDAWRVALGTLSWPDEQSQDERDGDVRAVAATLRWIRAEIARERKLLGAVYSGAWIDLEDRFMDRIAALEARDAKEVGSDG